MSEQNVINAFLEGRIGQWAFYRQLVKVGVSVGTALTLTLGLPAVVRGEQTLEDLASKSKQTHRGDLFELERLLGKVGNAFLPAVQNENLNPLAVNLASLGVNVDIPLNEKVELNHEGMVGNMPVNLVGTLSNVGDRGDVRHINVVLDGNLGSVPINLAGSVNAPIGNDQGVNVNLGNANLNFSGNAGNLPLNFSGNIGDVDLNDKPNDKR
jgi:hypothetical protein